MNMNEQQSDNWIQHNVPGGLNSPMGQQLDNAMGGNPNPMPGQGYGGAPPYGGQQHGFNHGRRDSSDERRYQHHGRRDSSDERRHQHHGRRDS